MQQRLAAAGSCIMLREDVLKLLQEHLARLRNRYHIKTLSLFGSVARDEATADSDVDILVEFEGHVGLRGFMDCRFDLEHLLGRKVDLVMASAVKPSRRPHIDAEAIRVA